MARVQRQRAYGITIYRDEDGEANVESRFVGSEPSSAQAIKVAQSVGPTVGWPLWSASVDEGEEVRERTRDGIYLTRFEDDPTGRHWNIGPDWVERS
jgi:hypothetical protein